VTAALVISIASSAPGDGVASSGDSGAQSRHARVAGAVHSAPEVGGGYAHSVKRAFSPRGSVTVKQDLGTSGAVHSERVIPGKASANLARADEHMRTASAAIGARSEQTAGSSVLPTALNPAYQVGQTASPERPGLGRRTAARTSEVALRSGGEANFAGHLSGRVGTTVSASAAWKTVARSERCPARKGLRFYIAATNLWYNKMGAARVGHPTNRVNGTSRCPRYLARVMRSKARAARVRYERWHRYHYAWREWLPAVWQRLARCETGVRWDWDSGSYVSAFGIYRPGYAEDAHRIGNLSWDETKRKLGRLPTPREQYEAALSHFRAHGGFDGWGCRGA